jgi:hypothetical protein
LHPEAVTKGDNSTFRVKSRIKVRNGPSMFFIVLLWVIVVDEFISGGRAGRESMEDWNNTILDVWG